MITTTSYLLLLTDLLVIILSVHYQLIKSTVNTTIIPPSLINHAISPASSLDIHPPHTSNNIIICSAPPRADVVIVVARGKGGVQLSNKEEDVSLLASTAVENKKTIFLFV